MTSLVDSANPIRNLVANGMTIVNSFVDKPYYFPHTMTLFQPSRSKYDDSNMEKDENGSTPFLEWYGRHNRKTVVSMLEEYGGNVSYLKCLGAGSYEIQLATYSPTELMLEHAGEDGTTKQVTTRLDDDQFRKMRSSNDEYKEFVDYDENGESHIVKKYVFDNGTDKTKVGFKFNLFDNFITGNDRTLRLSVPKDTDFNRLHLKFRCDAHHEPDLPGECEYVVFVDDHEEYKLKFPSEPNEEEPDPNMDIPIEDAVLEAHDFEIKVIIHYQVDFSRRNTEKEYQDLLKKSGLTLMDMRIDNDVVETKRQLTFADYVNEVGIPEEEHDRRQEEFWQVSQYKRDVPYQLVLETSLKNSTSTGLAYPNNYSTGDIYGDVFATKSILDSFYDMNLTAEDLNESTDKYETLCAEGREYLNIGQCSSQLFLTFKPTKTRMRYGEDDGDFHPLTTRTNMDERPDNGNYQLVEVVRNINRFESSIKHKSNVFSVLVQNSSLAKDPNVDMTNTESNEYKLEKYKESLRNSITQFVRNACEDIVPVHTQLFDVQFS